MGYFMATFSEREHIIAQKGFFVGIVHVNIIAQCFLAQLFSGENFQDPNLFHIKCLKLFVQNVWWMM